MVSLRRSSLVAVVAAVAVALTACTGAGDTSPASTHSAAAGVTTGPSGGQQLAIGKPVEGGSMTYALSSPVQALDPAGTAGQSILFAMQQIYGTLMKFQPDGTVVPNLAESLTTTDNKVWTLKLPAGLKFTDGTSFDAQAVIDQETNVAAAGSKAIPAGDARNIASMTAPDAQTVEFTLKAPNNQFGLLLAEGSMAMIPSPTAKAAAGADFATKPVGAGPFKVDSFVPGSQIVLSKNTGYKFASQGLPYLQKLTLTTVADESSRESGVLSGDLDGATVGLPVLSDAESQGITGLKQPVFSTWTLIVNNQDKVLSDARVRAALSEAIDRVAVNQVVYKGLQPATTTLLAPNQPFAKNAPKLPLYDLTKAKQAMKDAGVSNLKLTIMVAPGGGDDAKIATLLQQMFAKIDVTATIAPTDPSAQVGLFSQGDFQAAMVPMSIPAETTKALSQFFTTGSSRNFSGASVPAFDALAAKASAAATNADRQAVIPDMLKVLTDNVVAIPVVTAGAGRILGKRVLGFPEGDPNSSIIEMVDLSRAWVKK